MKDKETFFISTAIPYVNSRPHLGFAQELVLADIAARFNRKQGRDVFFLNGTDDNSLKNVLSAEEVGAPVDKFVQANAEVFSDLSKKLGISNDDFIQTASDKRHVEGAQKLWLACKKEDIYKKTYKGLYCVGCEEFKREIDLINGECPEHPGKKLEVVEEENYFFKLSKYQKELEDLISSGKINIFPETRRNETLAFIKEGLQDFSISRSGKRARGWGIPVPGDPDQIMYVWFDALSNYINALDYGSDGENFKKFWIKGDDRVHLIGKGINRFHTVYWPAMLLSAGLSLPNKIVIHGYMTVNGEKMSKSIGNVIDPFPLLLEYGVEGVRFFLAKEMSSFEDSDFTATRFKEAYNAGLANGIGNLVSRIMKMSSEHLGGVVDIEDDKNFLPDEFVSLLGNFEIQKAAQYLWAEITDIDLQIQQEAPFKVVKEHKEAGQALIRSLVHRLYKVAEMLEMFLPETSEKIKNCIKENKMPEVSLFPRKD